MRKIISVVGARPNFIKLAALHPYLKKSFNHVIVHTGQHYDYELSQNFFEELSLPNPNYNLQVGSQASSDQIKLIKSKSQKVLEREKPDLVLVYGDTNSTVGGAQASHAAKIPLAHVEAGVRSFDDSMPEEINRKTVDHLSNILFCPTQLAVKNLKNEGIKNNSYFTGDTMYEVLLKIKPSKSILSNLGIRPKEYYFATIHRQENTDNLKRLKTLIKSLSKLDRIVIFPLHPRTKKSASSTKNDYGNIMFIDPVNFKNSISLQQNSIMILTDSGGIQKEAYYLKIPCLTLRSKTEWPETVASGWNKLVDCQEKKILKCSRETVLPKKHPNYFGNGDASIKIVQIIKEFLYD